MNQPTLPDWTKQEVMPRTTEGRWADFVVSEPSDSGYANQATVTVGISLDSDRRIEARKQDLLCLERQARANVLELMIRYAGKGILDRHEPLIIASARWLDMNIADARAAVAETNPEDFLVSPEDRTAILLGNSMQRSLFCGKPEDQSVVSVLLGHQINAGFDWRELAAKALRGERAVLSAMSFGGLADVILGTVDWLALAADLEEDEDEVIEPLLDLS